MRIVERLRLLRQAHAQVSMLQFNVGERVCFQADARGTICGTLFVTTKNGHHPHRGRRRLSRKPGVTKPSAISFSPRASLSQGC